MQHDRATQRFSIHGLAAAVRLQVPQLSDALKRALGEFQVTQFGEGASVTEGIVRPYDKAEVLKHLSPTAVTVSGPRDAMELYQDNERFWLIDDRWGLAEVNLLKGQFRSWVLNEPAIELDRAVEMAITWPLAQLMRGKGLYLLPAAGMARGERGVMLIAPFGIEPELSAMLRAGYRIVGQRWVALRSATRGAVPAGDHEKVEMLHMPGRVERNASPARRAIGDAASWVDLESEFCGGAASRATCSTVVLIEPGRRPTPLLRPIASSGVLPALRRAWPIAELHPHRVVGQMPTKLSRRCQVFSARLSNRPQDLMDLLDNAHGTLTRTLPQLEAPPTSIAV